MVMKKILVVSHCILNTASKVSQDESELKEEYEWRNRLMQLVLEKNIQLIQLPCPEFTLYGSKRWGHVKNQFMHPHYRRECEKMLEPVFMQLEEYLSDPEEFQILGIVSVEGSPSCGYRLTCRGNWGGEFGKEEEVKQRRATLKMVQEPGVMMEILEKELENRKLQIPIVSMPDAVNKLQSLL